MKVIFISDIHGIKTNLPKIKERFEELNCDKLVVLGDLYYTGPRNKILKDYDVDYVRNFLEEFKDKLICIRGNCDADIDIEISDFPIITGLGLISSIKEDLYLTHGHIYNESNWPKTNSILIYGHLHQPFIKEIETNTYINPGSISMPRTNIGPTYLFYDENEFIIYDLNDQEIVKKVMKN